MKRIIEKIATEIAKQLKSETNTEVSTLPVFFTVEDVCKILHISKATVYRHRDLGFLVPATYVGRKPLFTQESIDNYLKNFNGKI